MADTIIKVQTWACPNCPYKQHHDPANELQMNQIFREVRYAGRPQQACPACYAGENPQREKGIHHLEAFNGADLSQLAQKKVASDETLEAMRVPEFDDEGQPVMEQTGSRWELRVNPDTDEISSEPVPVYSPKMRSLTTQELAELKLQRNQSLDKLSKVAVKEVIE